MPERKIRVACFASGSGSNVENFANYSLTKNCLFEIALVVCNNSKAGVLDRCSRLQIPIQLLTNQQAEDGQIILDELKKTGIDFIVLAGWLRKVSINLIEAFEGRIVNIHPALLPLFGGKGMYGMAVHEAVVNQKMPQSGITIHLVNCEYDKGEILKQAKVDLVENETAESLAQKIHALEYEFYPKVVNEYLDTLIRQERI